MKRFWRFLFLLEILALLLFIGYQQLTESQKRFVHELLRQVPYLLPRYFV